MRTANDERGSILLSLLALVLLGTIISSQLIVTSSEMAIAGNIYCDSQARHLADAGYAHGLAYLVTEARSLDEFLVGNDGRGGTADDGVLIDPAPVSLGDGTYRVWIRDNDDADGDPTTDSDGEAVLVAVGRARLSESMVRAPVSFRGGGGAGSTPPYLFGNSLTCSNVTRFLGRTAPVHSNGRIEIGDAEFWGEVTASSEIDVDQGTILDGQPLSDDAYDDYMADHEFVPDVKIPEVVPEDYRPLADFVMGADGGIRDGDGRLVYDASDSSTWNGWKWQGSRWTMSNVKPEMHKPGTYFVEGNLETSSANGTAENPLEMTLITTGYLKFTGKTFVESHDNDILMVVGTDLEFTGATDAFTTVGHILVHEQMKASGKFSLLGGIVVEDAEDLDGKIKRSSDGTKWSAVATLNYDGSLIPLPGQGGGTTGIAVTAWYRE